MAVARAEVHKHTQGDLCCYTGMLLLSALRQNHVLWKSIPSDSTQPCVLRGSISTGSLLGWVVVLVQQHLKFMIWECTLLSLE